MNTNVFAEVKTVLACLDERFLYWSLAFVLKLVGDASYDILIEIEVQYQYISSRLCLLVQIQNKTKQNRLDAAEPKSTTQWVATQWLGLLSGFWKTKQNKTDKQANKQTTH